MPSEGKVGSLFVEFRTNLNQFVADVQRMVNEVRSFDSTVKSASKSVSDLGHLGSAAAVKIAADLVYATSGVNALANGARQASIGVADIGHLGSPAVKQVAADLVYATSGVNALANGARQASGGISDLGHLGSTSVNQVTTSFTQLSNQIRQFDRILYPFQRLANDVGLALTAGITVPLTAASAFALKTGIDFETAFSGVRQTLGGSEESLAKVRQELIDLSKVTPTSAVEFADIATNVAKLGVEAPNIARFASTINELTTVTKLSGEEATDFIGRFSNITHLDPSQIHNFASTLFALGKAFPAVENEIANFALRVAKTGTFVGLSSGEILAFSTALASVGVTAQLGGTAISRVLADMSKASEDLNSVKLAQFASVAGKSAREFAEEFRTNAAGAVLDFVKGLKRIKEEGGNVFATLDALKLGDRRLQETLLALALGNEEFAKALRVQGVEMQQDGELTRAYGEKLKTTRAELEIFKHQIDALGISLFGAFKPLIDIAIPALARFINDGVKPVIDGFVKLPTSVQFGVGAMLLFAAAAGPAILVASRLAISISSVIIILEKLGEIGALERFAPALANVGSVASKLVGPLTLIGLAIAGWELENVIIDSLGLKKQFDELKLSAGELLKAVENLGGAFGRLAIKQAAAEFQNFKKVLDEIIVPVKTFVTAWLLIQFARSNAEIKGLTGFLNDLTKAMDGTTTSANSLPAAMARVLAASTNSLPAAMARVMASFKQGGDIGPLGPSPEEIEAQAKALEALRKEHEKLIAKFTEELAPANALNEELDFLLKHFSTSDVVDVYGKKIVDAAETQRNHGIAVTGATAKLFDQAKALETVQERLKELKDVNKEVPTFNAQIAGGFPGLQLPTSPLESKALTSFGNAREQIADLGLAIRNLSFLGANVEIELFGKDLDEAAKFAKAFGFELDPSVQALLDQKKAAEDAAAGVKAWEEAANKGIKTADEMAGQIDIAGEAVRRMVDAGFADASILDILGTVIDDAAKNAKTLGIELDPVIAKLAKMREEMKDDAKGASDFGKEVSRAATRISTDLARGIADALINSRSLVDVAKKIGKDFAAAFIEAVVNALVKKLVDKLAEALASHPVVAAIVAAVVAAVAVVRSLTDSHLFANQFVKETQNPFAKSLTQFVDTANQLYIAGRQTYQGAQEAQVKITEMWQGFLDDAEKFGQQGRKQATVAQQAIETLSPTFRRVIFDIQQQIETLKPPSVRAVESVGALASYRAQIAANTDEHIAQLQAEATAINDQIQELQRQIDVQQELGGSTAELNAQMQELIYQWDAVRDALDPLLPKLYTFAEAVKSVSENLVPDKTLQFLDQVLNATSGSANLEEALGILEQIGTPVAIIVDRLGSDLENFANALTLSGLPIPPLIEKYLKLKNASSAASAEMPRIANSLSKLVGDAVDKLRNIAGGGDLAQGILDALARLLTGLPGPGGAIQDPTSVAVDKLRGVTEDILVTLKDILHVLPGGAIAAPDFAAVPQPATMQVMVNIADNESIINEFNFSAVVTRAEVRNNVIPEITEVLTNNTDSVRQKWIDRLSDARLVKK